MNSGYRIASCAVGIMVMEKAEMNGKRCLAPLFFLGGLAAGIALTVFLAPRSGAATRRLIGRKVEEGKDWAKDKASAAQDYVRGQGEELRDRAKKVAEAIRGS
jgi:gas vesicle protein